MRRFLWLFMLPLAVWAQLGDNTVTVTASRQLPNLQPDQAVFEVTVTAGGNASLNDVLAELAGTGITAANLSGVQGSGSTTTTTTTTAGPATTQWSFLVTVPLSQLGSTIAALQAAAKAPSAQVYYSVSAQVSPQLLATQPCPYALLVAEAQGQAQTLAAAAGATVGPILWVSDGSTLGTGIAAVRTGEFSAAIAGLSIVPFPGIVIPPSTCTMTVQFSLVN